MPSQKRESRSSREQLTYWDIAERLDHSTPKLEMLEELYRMDYATQSELLEANNRFDSRPNISTYLNKLEGKGIVEVTRSDLQNEPDQWYLTSEVISTIERELDVEKGPEVITETVVETQTVRYESFGEWFDDYDTLVYVFLMGTIVGSLSVLYEILRFSLGVWPEFILFLSLPALFGVLLPGIKEVYF